MLTITSFKVTLETWGGTVVPLTGQILHQHQLLLSHRAAEDRSNTVSISAYHFSFHPLRERSWLQKISKRSKHFPSNTCVQTDKRVQIKTFDLLSERPSRLITWGGGIVTPPFLFTLFSGSQNGKLGPLRLLVVMETPESVSSRCEVPEMRARGPSADSSCVSVFSR